MSTFVLEVQFNDATDEQDIVFSTLAEVATYLNGQHEDDYAWICLHDHNNDYVFEGWSDIVQYIRENTGPKSSCIALNEPEHSMEGSEWVIDPFDAYEPGELPPAPVGTVTFGELEDGAEFYYAQTYAYGSRIKFQKTLEDGGKHNAVHVVNTNIGVIVPADRLVIRA